MLTALSGVEFPELNSVTLDGDTLSAENFYESLGVLPFMSRVRVIVVREYYPKAADKTYFKKQNLDGQLTGNVLVIISNRKKSEITKAVKFTEQVDCTRADAQDMAQWATAMLRSKGLKISAPAALKLAQFCGRDMQRVENEIEKLSEYCRDTKTVTDKDIMDIVSSDNEYQIYLLTSMIAEGQGDKAYAMIADYERKGETGYAPMFLGLLGNYYRRMYYVKGSRVGDGELSAQLNIKPYAVKMLRKDAAGMDLHKIKHNMDTVTGADYRIKSGAMTAGTALKYVLGQLL